jgi:hypothetical protein
MSSADDGQSQETPPEIEAAYKEARERGLPEGWTCSIDVSNEVHPRFSVVVANTSRLNDLLEEAETQQEKVDGTE